MTVDKQKIDSSKSRAAEEAISQIKERFGEGSIMRLGEARKIKVEVIPTGKNHSGSSRRRFRAETGRNGVFY